jgi:glycosyltransferase involved in cell wall biosynthesis
MPLITVGIPFYNSQETLADAIKSVFAQSFSDWELLLVDDGSTDRSLEIANSIKDPRVRVITDGKNRKLAARLNQIIDLARGEYIARMDADDLCSPDRFQKQLNLLEVDKKIDVVGCGMIYLGKKDEPLGRSIAAKTHNEICRHPYKGFGLCHASILARKDWCRNNRYNEEIHLGQDFNLWLNSYRSSYFANISEPLYYYRIEASYKLKKQYKDRIASASYLFKHFARRGLIGKAFFSSGVQYLKMLAETAFFVFGAQNYVLRRRYKHLSSEEREKYCSIIQKIKKTNCF